MISAVMLYLHDMTNMRMMTLLAACGSCNVVQGDGCQRKRTHSRKLICDVSTSKESELETPRNLGVSIVD